MRKELDKAYARISALEGRNQELTLQTSGVCKLNSRFKSLHFIKDEIYKDSFICIHLPGVAAIFYRVTRHAAFLIVCKYQHWPWMLFCSHNLSHPARFSYCTLICQYGQSTTCSPGPLWKALCGWSTNSHPRLRYHSMVHDCFLFKHGYTSVVLPPSLHPHESSIAL